MTDRPEKTILKFDTTTLEESADRITALHAALESTELSGSDAEAEQFYMLALASLDEARRFMWLAYLNQTRTLAENGRRR